MGDFEQDWSGWLFDEALIPETTSSHQEPSIVVASEMPKSTGKPAGAPKRKTAEQPVVSPTRSSQKPVAEASQPKKRKMSDVPEATSEGQDKLAAIELAKKIGRDIVFSPDGSYRFVTSAPAYSSAPERSAENAPKPKENLHYLCKLEKEKAETQVEDE